MLKWLIGAGVSLTVITPAVIAWAMAGSQSLRAQFLRESAERARAAATSAATISESDLATLPPPVRRYLMAAGVVGRPRTHSYRLTFTGRIRGGPDEAWMPFTAEQYSAVDEPVREVRAEDTEAPGREREVVRLRKAQQRHREASRTARRG